MRPVPKPTNIHLKFAVGFFILAALECVASAIMRSGLFIVPLIAGLYLGRMSGNAWSLHWRWRAAYKKWEEWNER